MASVYIERLHLTNIKCFEDLKIDFLDENSEPRKWTVLVGDNGAGKSTVLQAIAACLAGADRARTLLPPSEHGHWLRVGAGRACMMVRFRPGAHDPGEEPPEDHRWLEDSFGGPPPPRWSFSGALPSHSSPGLGGWFACGYGPYRRLSTPSESRPMPPWPDPLATLFNGSVELSPPSGWLQDAHYQSVGGSSGEMRQQGERRLGAIKRALEAVLPEVQDVFVSREEVTYQTPYGRIPAEGLSDGYGGMLTWVADILARLSLTFPDAEELLQCEGVVLVDEIDAHLHPAWQRKVISTLRETFPNLQFIVTTHSPLTVGGARDGEVVLLKREGDKVVAETDFDSVQGWRADQILTSDLFGLTSTRDAETERLLEERRALFAKGEQRTEEENRRFEELAVELQAFLPRPGDTPDERREQEHRRELTEWIERQIPEDELEGIKASLRDELRQRRAAREGARQE